VTFASDAMTLDGLQVTLGKTTAEGRVSVRRFTAPVVDFQLAANTLDVVEMQQLLAPAPARAVAATPAAATAGDTSLLTATTGTGRLRVGTITNGPLVLENVQATVVLDRGVIRLDPLTAAVYGGRHSGAIVVDASRTPATFSVTCQLELVDANKLASATTSLRDVLYGALASSLRVSASTNGVEGIAKSLNGTLSLNLPNGRLAKMDLLQEMANIGRFVTGRANAERATQIAALTGTFLVTNGVARTDDLRASLDGGMLGATGTINLVDQSVNMRLAAVLSREASQRAGGSRIGGFMTTALANEQGELVVPMLLSGTMSQPRFAPDVQRIAEMKLKNLVPTLRSPGSLGALLGAVTGRGGAERPAAPPGSDAPAAPSPDGAAGTAPEAGAPPPASTPADQIQDALRGLLGGRRRAAPPPPKPAAPAPAQPDGAGK
jgi:AsmA protein